MERVTGIKPAYDFRLAAWKAAALSMDHTRVLVFDEVLALGPFAFQYCIICNYPIQIILGLPVRARTATKGFGVPCATITPPRDYLSITLLESYSTTFILDSFDDVFEQNWSKVGHFYADTMVSRIDVTVGQQNTIAMRMTVDVSAESF